jgi:hypothetical protein
MATPVRNHRLMARPTVPLLALLPALLAACAEVGSPNLTFWDVIFGLIAFFLWFMFIWIFITLFGDIFRRDDLSGVAKAVWVLALVLLPFLGSLIYIVARPKLSARDVERIAQADAGPEAVAAASPADQIAKAAELRAAGLINDEEYGSLKQKAIG